MPEWLQPIYPYITQILLSVIAFLGVVVSVGGAFLGRALLAVGQRMAGRLDGMQSIQEKHRVTLAVVKADIRHVREGQVEIKKDVDRVERKVDKIATGFINGRGVNG